MIKKFYHTQESRNVKLKEPLKCIRDDAWLGDAFYYWLDLSDAEHWGNKSKKSTGYYEIYACDIDCENVLNTVFNEEEYYFWYKQIEKVAKAIISKTKLKPSIKELNDYFKERGVWDEVSGILFQDLPINPIHSLVKPIEYQNNKRMIFAYRKRIQLAVYDLNIMCTFAFLKKEQCIF